MVVAMDQKNADKQILGSGGLLPIFYANLFIFDT